ncbi:bifunctional UDP-sugar hydrolase/5'-nucleotidase [Prolixibacter sp. SD074]|uniref:bifunctional metallophosphatase/5'-nucleotidase n=1 Tax=Prolixibacter sp. SD074 TaxID=2652391 RepID=UPI0012708DA1|nr:bifunctional UDP-sugar hydrolase/5'-nucleotidase [Prolixibacter sp. SD074]GET30284.1 2',3'-cyclic-nucleotide 2'-phosphodiesterase [Prolixibacter sp. SD074]
MNWKHLARGRFLLLILSLTLLLSSCQEKTVNLEFIETSDVHGSLFPWNFLTDTTANHSLASVYSYVKAERAKPDQDVVLLDNGDILQGDPDVYFSNFLQPDSTNIVARVYNFMKYDAATPGNHDIEAGHAVYDKVHSEMHMPWLAANAVCTDNGKPYFQPYTIIEKEGVKIAVLGMITPHIPYWLPEKIWKGMEFHDIIETARKWVKIIQEKEHPDVMIGLFHSGVDYTYGGTTAKTYKNENASALVAEQVPGFDIVFAGHDHREWNKWVTNTDGKKVLIMGPQAHAREFPVAKMKLIYDRSSKSWKKEITSEVKHSKNYQPDPEYMAHFKPFVNEVKKWVNQPVAKLTAGIDTRDAFFGSSSFMGLIHHVQLVQSGADISLSAPTIYNTQLKKGELYVRDMFRLYKYENLLYTMKLSGKEIKGFLEYSYAGWFNTIKSPDDHLIKFRKDKDGNLMENRGNNTYSLARPYFNFDSAGGIRYTVDVRKPAGHRVHIISMSDGTPFRKNQVYKVAVNSYRGNGGGGHLEEGAGILHNELNARRISTTEKDLRFYMMKWLEKQGTYTPKNPNNWKVIPQAWEKKARATDEPMMFGKGNDE